MFKPTLRRRSSPAPRLEGDRDGLRRGRRDAPCATSPVPEALRAPVRALARRDASSSRARRSRSRSTTARAPASAAPMDIEWAKDGRDAASSSSCRRAPRRCTRSATSPKLVTYRLTERGAGAASRARRRHADRRRARSRGSTTPRRCSTSSPARCWSPAMTDPDWEPIMKTRRRHRHRPRRAHLPRRDRERASSASPAWSAPATPPRVLATGEPVTVSCAEGETGVVYDGHRSPSSASEVDVRDAARDRAPQILLNVGNPEQAFALSFLPGRRRRASRAMEFIITNAIGIHPMALRAPRAHRRPRRGARSPRARAAIPTAPTFFVEQLAEGVARIAAPSTRGR